MKLKNKFFDLIIEGELVCVKKYDYLIVGMAFSVPCLHKATLRGKNALC